MSALRFEIRVKPKARADHVGGSWGPRQALVVEVRAPAADGKANAAVTKVLAGAFGIAPREVKLVRGTTSRNKLVEIEQPPEGLDRLLAQLLGTGTG